MKKLIIVTFLSLLSLFSFVSIKAYTDSTEIITWYETLFEPRPGLLTIQYQDDFDLYQTVGTFATDVYGAELEVAIDETVQYFEIMLAGDVGRTLSEAGVESVIEFYDDSTSTWITFELHKLYPFYGTGLSQEERFQNLLVKSFNLYTGFSYFTIDNTLTTFDLSIYDITNIRLIIIFNNPIIDYNAKVVEYQTYGNSIIFTTSPTFRLELYDSRLSGTSLISAFDVIGGTLQDITYDVTPPSGYSLVGWQDVNGSIYSTLDYLLTSTNARAAMELIDDEYVLRLYTVYQNADNTIGGISTGTPSDIGGIRNIFGTFGLDTYTGYIIILIGVLFLTFLLLAALKLPLIIYFITTAGYVILWMFLGFLPLYISLIIGVILVTMFLSLKGGAVNE